MQIETVRLITIDGVSLAADIVAPPNAVAAAVIAHPHPLFGGNRQNPVVDSVFRAIVDAGHAAIRFDFRGAGASGGDHDQGVAEHHDVVAAIDALCPAAPQARLRVIGYSFGAHVALDVIDPRISGWMAIAGVRLKGLAAGRDPRPKRLLVAEHDQYSPPTTMAAETGEWLNTSGITISMTDHFLHGRLDVVARHALDFVQQGLAPAPA